MRKRVITGLVFPVIIGSILGSAGVANATESHAWDLGVCNTRYGGVRPIFTYVTGGGELDFSIYSPQKIKSSSYVLLWFKNGTTKSYVYTSNNGGKDSGIDHWSYSNITDHPDTYKIQYVTFQGPDGAVDLCVQTAQWA